MILCGQNNTGFKNMLKHVGFEVFTAVYLKYTDV